jgi:hypothetical protein
MRFMAQMIPDRLPSGSSRGEQRLFAILQKLPDDYLVYYEPVISERYPDFVILAPDLGVIIIEVKGWYPGDILGGDSHTVRLRMRGLEKKEAHPVRQARRYQNDLRDECRKCLEAKALLLHADGPYEGQFRFPFCHFAVLSNLSAEQLKHHDLGDLTPLFAPARVLPRDGLLEWENLPGAQIRDKLKAFFDPYWDIARLSDRQVDVLRGVIHPEIRIESRFDSAQLAVLDLRQERHARSIGSGHRIVYGVAGSGKTILLLARARLLSQQGPDKEILVLCFNFALAAYLAGVLACCGNVRVHHFDGWAKANGVVRRRGTEGQSSESHESLGTRFQQHLQQGKGDARRFDAVLVDEAQDFDATWFACILESMKDPEDGDLLIVGDRQQGIYGAKSIVWSSVGIRAVGRTIHAAFDLDKNYRNSREILELAATFAQDQEQLSDDQFGVVPVDSAKALRATGIRSLLLRGNSRRHECQRLFSVVATLLQAGGRSDPRFPEALLPGQIGILYPRIPNPESPLLDELLNRLGTLAPVVWLRDRDRHRVGEPAIKVQSIHASKGLQYAAAAR